MLTNLSRLQGFSQNYQKPGLFRAIPSLCFRGPWLGTHTLRNHILTGKDPFSEESNEF